MPQFPGLVYVQGVHDSSGALAVIDVEVLAATMKRKHVELDPHWSKIQRQPVQSGLQFPVQ